MPEGKMVAPCAMRQGGNPEAGFFDQEFLDFIQAANAGRGLHRMGSQGPGDLAYPVLHDLPGVCLRISALFALALFQRDPAAVVYVEPNGVHLGCFLVDIHGRHQVSGPLKMAL